jgi:hypothetical protein
MRPLIAPPCRRTSRRSSSLPASREPLCVTVVGGVGPARARGPPEEVEHDRIHSKSLHDRGRHAGFALAFATPTCAARPSRCSRASDTREPIGFEERSSCTGRTGVPWPSGPPCTPPRRKSQARRPPSATTSSARGSRPGNAPAAGAFPIYSDSRQRPPPVVNLPACNHARSGRVSWRPQRTAS